MNLSTQFSKMGAILLLALAVIVLGPIPRIGPFMVLLLGCVAAAMALRTASDLSKGRR